MYRLAEEFTYRPRWTSGYYGLFRDLIRAMCMDSGDELKRAWKAILAGGGPAANPEAMRRLEALPERPFPLDWRSAITEYSGISRPDCLREWTAFFRAQYRLAEAAAERRQSEAKTAGKGGT